MTVSIIVPTYEEAQTAPRVVSGVLLEFELKNIDLEGEVIVVDDSPTSATVDAIREMTGDPDELRCIRRDGSGLASAVLRGFDEADGDVYAVMDADGQHPSMRVHDLVERVDAGADLALGSRFCAGGEVVEDWPVSRWVISLGAAKLAKTAVPQSRPLSDPLTGFFAVDADVVESARERLRPSGYKIALELIARCPIREIHEVPITFGTREMGESNLGPQQAIEYLWHMGRLIRPSRQPAVRVVTSPQETL